jgi:hypothetical protein
MSQDVEQDASRDETRSERMDRNWDELLQELRVTQTGIQILTGFLLTLPFQQRFQQLDEFQRRTFLLAVLLAATATGIIVAPVAFHRLLFRRGQKDSLVAAGDRLAKAGLTVLGAAVSVVVLLVFDVAAARSTALLASGAVLGLFVLLWLVLPIMSRDTKDAGGTR